MGQLTQEQNDAIARAVARTQQQAAIQRTVQGMQQPAPAERGFWQALGDNVIGFDDGVTSPGEQLGTWLNRGGESMTLGLAGDELNAATYGMLPGRSYEGELERFRQNEEDLGPWGQLSADVTGGVIPALLGVGAVAQASTLPRAIGRGIGLGAGAGATQGFMEGDGGIASRVQSGGIGAGLGGVLGGAIPAVGAVAGNVAGRIGEASRNSGIGRDIAAALGVRPQTGATLGEMMSGLDPRDMDAALTRAGPDAMLADAAPVLGMNLGAAVRTQNPGSQLAIQRVGDRAATARDSIVESLTGGGQRTSVGAAMNASRDARQPLISPLYQQAYATPIDYASDAGRAIEDIFERMPARIVNQALASANERAAWEGNIVPQIMAQIDDAGRVTFQEMPNVQQLDYIKRALDAIASDSADAMTGRLTSEGALASNMARTLREAVGGAAPAYREALSASADSFAEQNAIRFGSELLRPQTTTYDAVQRIQNATDAERAAMRIGAGEQIQEALGNVYAVASDPNVDARQASAALRALSSDNSRAKLAALFGEEWPAIQSQLDRASAAVSLRAGIAPNSATAANQMFNEMVTSQNTPGALAQGQPLQAARNMWSDVLGASPEAIRRASGETRGEIADLLTRGNPQQSLSAVAQALAARPANPNRGTLTREIVEALGFMGIPQANFGLQERLGTL